MRGYWRFFRRETPLLTYGLSLTFLSSVGQTFLVSLFVPFFLRDFALSEGGFGVLYAGATLGSALLLPVLGRRLDRTRLHRFTLGVVALLAGSAFLMAAASHLAVLGVALLGVRLGGQGLSSHTALTTMARYYEAARGRALGVSNLGFPLGEGILPLLVTAAIARSGWRTTWVALGILALLFAPVLVRLLRGSGVELDPEKLARTLGDGPGDGRLRFWRRGEVLRDARFWLLLPATLLPAFWITGLFLYQTSIAGVKGWSLPLMASAFLVFAATRVGSTVATGEASSARRAG